MKITLIQESGIQILSVTDTVADQNVQVLKAGITKLLKNGHNRIILELLSPNAVVPSALAGISLLHELARDLNGDLVVVYPKAPKPAAMKLECYPDRVAALAHFTNPQSKANASAPAGSGNTELLELIEKQKTTIEELRKKLLNAGVDVLSREMAALKEENRTLKQRLDELVLAFRTPQSNSAYNEKITVLENEIVRLEQKLSQGLTAG